MGRLRRAWLRGVSAVSWRLPGWPRRLLRAFGLAEQGSFHDMIAAAEQTTDRQMRRRYLEHALDEARHSGLFRRRVEALDGQVPPHKPMRARAREQAATEEANLLTEHGIVGGQTLFERLGELEFLAFVYVAERDAVEQFHVYLDDQLPDPDTCTMLRDILRDEHFHVSYSRAALERFRSQGRAREVRWALWRVQWRRLKEGWLRGSRDLGRLVTGAWLTLLYLVVVAPFSLVGRLEAGGWQAPPPDPRPGSRAARSMA